MFLDKFRNRYSFNFLSIIGILTFLLIIYLLISFSSPGLGTPLTFMFLSLFFADLASFGVAIIIYTFEEIFNKKITNEKFLKSKIIFIIQLLGIIFLLIFVSLVLYIIFRALFIDNVTY